jgi:hypothetical protein
MKEIGYLLGANATELLLHALACLGLRTVQTKTQQTVMDPHHTLLHTKITLHNRGRKVVRVHSNVTVLCNPTQP